MTTNIFLAIRNGWMFRDGKLRAYQFKSALVDFEYGLVTYSCILGGKEVAFTTAKEPMVYASKEDYEKGKALENHHYTWSQAVCDSLFWVNPSINESGEHSCYIVENNEVKMCPTPKSNFLFNSYRDVKYMGKGKFYESKNQASLYCDLVKVDENGKETVYPSPAKRVALDEEQMSILKEVENALAKAKNAGIRFVCDIDDDSLYAYSNKQIKGVDYDCCCDRHISSYGYGINDLMTEVSDGGNCTAIARSDCDIFVKFNEEE